MVKYGATEPSYFGGGLLLEHIMHNDQPIRYFIYARKSTDDTSRQVRSISDQQSELWQLAHQHGLDVVDVLVEKQSAKKGGIKSEAQRPGE